ncbi:hypothetical protein BJV77DRAFT_312795 [Russula vinacea]|nr:hypothetical protein BJV77DRAFT_312795 [Russula vinacea]
MSPVNTLEGTVLCPLLRSHPSRARAASLHFPSFCLRQRAILIRYLGVLRSVNRSAVDRPASDQVPDPGPHMKALPLSTLGRSLESARARLQL